VDYAVAPGTPVRSAGAGLVVFAGMVAGGLHVVVAHAGGLRTGYSYLSGIAVKKGDTVARGTVVGLSGGTGPAHGAGVFHFSLREADRYTDPMALFGATVVRLAPLDRPVPVTCRPAPGPERPPGPAATLTRDPIGERLRSASSGRKTQPRDKRSSAWLSSL
jgi:murein DD-endopeptidase MepM/ murein hydrolase activator NlpD